MHDGTRPAFTSSPRSPTPEDSNRTTVGVEFEFLLAVTRAHRLLQDPHPNDPRWQARQLVDFDEDSSAFQVSVRNVIVDTLRQNGVAAVKSEETEIEFTPTTRFGWLDSHEDIMNCPNAASLDAFVGHYRWDPTASRDDNTTAAVEALLDQFRHFHVTHKLRIYETKHDTVTNIANNKVPGFLEGKVNCPVRLDIADIFEYRARRMIEEEGNENEKHQRSKVDPNSVNLPGANPKYRAWTCTVDHSVGMWGFNSSCYEVPDGSIQARPVGDTDISNPLGPQNLYKWFPGELRTPILDYDHPDTLPALQRACGALRDTYRVHKPMSRIGTGIHIHFGQEKGWRLLHLKKFTTLWVIFEDSLAFLHRLDRSKDLDHFCLSVWKHCPISRALFKNESVHWLSNLRTSNPDKARDNIEEMLQHVPTKIDSPTFTVPKQEIVNEIWLYDTVTNLNNGLCASLDLSIKFRTDGNETSDNPDWDHTQTLEVRLMQGTLDAEHIWRWMTICQRMIIFARDTSPAEFHDGVRDMLLMTRPFWEVLNIPKQYMGWFSRRRNKDTGYFQYPDNDRVNWGDPFMTFGYDEVHNQPS
ncbi:hypothetical protein F4804DRAFT_347039 [Jackrogersella minutella]|nr:hypothetical protein F4804DRAFT_347039 [Jackrogersella minutella]